VGDILKKNLFFFTVRATFDDLRNWFFADLSVPPPGNTEQGRCWLTNEYLFFLF
jgi:hypothetical protein